jgi:hypothetical protein
MRYRFDLFFANANSASRLAMLRINKLACTCPAHPCLAKLAQMRVEDAVSAAIENEPAHCMIEYLGH